jgi:PhoH-like ATPase
MIDPNSFPGAGKDKKVFVLDTNVILHDSTCLYHFDEHDVVIPIVVIEELDRFKKGKDILNCNAREFLRSLDALTGDSIFNGGIPIGVGKGNISVRLGLPFHREIAANFSKDKVDHHILNAAYHVAHDTSFQRVVLVTKDINLRMKAKSVGLLSEDYTTDHVKNISELYKGKRVVENIPEPIIDLMYTTPYVMGAGEMTFEKELLPNEFLIMRNGSKSALGVYDAKADQIKRIENMTCYGIRPRNAEQSFALNALLDRDIPLVTLSGKAGTGKTLLALAASLETKRHYRQIFLARPIVPLSNKDIGYLPGDINSKLDPYMQPLYDNLTVLHNQFSGKNGRCRRIEDLLAEEKIVITPLSYIRGRSIVKVFFIVDEAQNLTPHEVKTIITRAGEGTKLIFTGDVHQIDHPYLDSQSNGLSYLIEKMKGQKLYAHINLEKGERSELSDLAIQLL